MGRLRERQPASTVSIGADSTGTDWQTVGFWASLRAAAPLATDDGYNMFRISHPAPFGIKYWEVGNELYGNGYYYGGCGWEADMHVPYPASGACTDRMNNAALSPAAYGTAVKAYATAMKAVDSTIKIGGIVVGPLRDRVLELEQHGAARGVRHRRHGLRVGALVRGGRASTARSTTCHETDDARCCSAERARRSARRRYDCTGGANMPIAITEWGPNTNCGGVVFPTSTADRGAGRIAGRRPVRRRVLRATSWSRARWRCTGSSCTTTATSPASTRPTIPSRRRTTRRAGATTPRRSPTSWRAAATRMVTAAQSGTFGAQLKAHASVHADGNVAS